MDALVSQITALATGASAATRRSILDALRELQYKLESPEDTTIRIWGGHVSIALVRTAIDLKIFEYLANSDKPLTVKELTSLTGADEILLARILRALAGYSYIKETGPDEFGRNNITETLARPGDAATIKHYFDAVGPTYQETPAWFKRNGYKNPTNSHDTVFQAAANTKQNCFEWMLDHPVEFANLNIYMAARRASQITWIAKYPLRDDIDLTKLSPERVLFIDVGGGLGHQAAEFHAHYPDLPGRVVNQDLSVAIEQAKAITKGIEHITHDFFTPQPIKGAKFYYMRAVLHDWPDDKCITILQHQIDAMAEDSIILVDDMVLPNQGVPWEVTQIDITMMVAGASVERTESQWNALFDAVGLKVVKRVVYTPAVHETITALVRK